MSGMNIAMGATGQGTKAMTSISSRLANTQTNGFIGSTEYFVHMAVQGVGMGSYVTNAILQSDKVGAPIITQSYGDLMIQGNGLMTVIPEGTKADHASNYYYLKTGAFDLNKNGNLEDKITNSLLMGWKLGNDGKPENPSTAGLTPINIDTAMSIPGQATTEVNDLSFKLRAVEVASGNAQVTMFQPTHANANAIRGSSVMFSEVYSDPIKNREQVYQYGGFIVSNELDNTATNILNGQDIVIKIGTASTTITAGAGVGANNMLQLTDIAGKINVIPGHPIQAEVVSEATGKVALKLSATGNEGFEITGGSALPPTTAWDGNIISVADAIAGTKRFSQLTGPRGLYAQLHNDGFNVEVTNGVLTISNNAGSMLYAKNALEGVPNSTPPATVSSWDVLSAFGVPTTPGRRGSIMAAYDPTDDDYNMAGEKVHPDYSNTIRVFDSKGGIRYLTVAFKKLNNQSWAIEIYSKEAMAQGAKKLPLQAGIISFSGTGEYQGVAKIPISSIGTKTFANPVAALPGVVPSVQIGGQLYTYVNANPNHAAGEFSSLQDLITNINNNPNSTVTASIIKQGSAYSIRTTTKAPGEDITVDNNAIALLGLYNKAYNVQTLGEKLTINWHDGVTLVSTSNIILNLDSGNIREYGGDSDYSLKAIPNGQEVGGYRGWYSDNGEIILRFSNGKEKHLYTVPVTTAQNPNGFQRSSSGTYEKTNKAGALYLHVSGVGGAGTVSSKALLSSGADGNEELQKAMQIQHYTQYNAASFSINRDTDEALLKRL